MKNVRIFVLNFEHTYTVMLTTTMSDFRSNIKHYLDKITQNFETLIIHRGKDRGVVIMSLDEYNSLLATRYELSSRVNAQRLDSAITKLNSGESISRNLIEE